MANERTSLTWDHTEPQAWPSDFQIIEIPSHHDLPSQKAYSRVATRPQRPLVISLHTWSGDYSQFDPIAERVAREDWNYLHPDFQGPNRRPEACLSPQVLADLEATLKYAVESSRVDPRNIFVTGASGGGYATLALYLQHRIPVKAFLAWVPISDLLAWYWQMTQRQSAYAEDILRCTSRTGDLNPDECVARSPLFWPLPAKPRSILEIYAGIHDGYTGSVPISHSLLFFNQLARQWGHEESAVSEIEMAALLSRGCPASQAEPIEGRHIYLHRPIPGLSLTIFEGAHEMLPDHCFQRLLALAGERGQS